MYNPNIARWNGVDALADSSISLTPYHYVQNDPINRIDPDGRDDFEINEKGEVVNRIENKKADNFYIVDSDGNRLEGQSISFKYGTVTALRHPKVNTNVSDEPTTLTIFEINGDDNATQLFEFMADPSNTQVEWTHAKIGKEDSDKNVVGNSGDTESTAVGGYLRATGYTLREVNHNHPSGLDFPSAGDRQGARLYNEKNPNTLLNIYTHPGKYAGYTQFGKVPTYAPTIITPNDSFKK